MREAKKRKAAKKKAKKTRKSNPGIVDNLAATGKELIPGAAAFAGNAVLFKLYSAIFRKLEARIPILGPHLTTVAILLTLGAVYAATSHKSLRPYRTSILLGSGLAAAVYLLPKYIPALGSLFLPAQAPAPAPVGAYPPSHQLPPGAPDPDFDQGAMAGWMSPMGADLD